MEKIKQKGLEKNNWKKNTKQGKCLLVFKEGQRKLGWLEEIDFTQHVFLLQYTIPMLIGW